VTRILLADDQALVRGGLKLILDAEPDLEVVAEAEDGLRAVELALTTRPDVALMDVRMPGLDGIEATRRLLAAVPSARVLMLTTFRPRRVRRRRVPRRRVRLPAQDRAAAPARRRRPDGVRGRCAAHPREHAPADRAGRPAGAAAAGAGRAS
jgi:chemotaxis response regulator CheB